MLWEELTSGRLWKESEGRILHTFNNGVACVSSFPGSGSVQLSLALRGLEISLSATSLKASCLGSSGGGSPGVVPVYAINSGITRACSTPVSLKSRPRWR